MSTAEDKDPKYHQRIANTRFKEVLKMSMKKNNFTQRELGEKCGFKIGTMTKYMRGEVNPFDVKFRIQLKLAHSLDVSPEALSTYYLDGVFDTELSRQDVTTWIMKEACTNDIPALLMAVSTSDAWSKSLAESTRYTWPAEALESKGVSQELRTRLGLSDSAMESIAQGEYEPDHVEAFALLISKPIDEVEKAFNSRSEIELD